MSAVRRPLTAFACAAGLVAGLVVALAAPAAAEPATTPSFTTTATANAFSGAAFDQCTAPSATAMSAWTASPYRAAGVYISGVNRTCAQPQLTPAWVSQVSGMGWRLVPIHVGLQPPCSTSATTQKISLTVATARAQGEAAANEAIAAATALGLQPGSALYNDIENYPTTSSSCRTAVLTYASYWTRRLHYKGWLSGVYANLTSGARDLANVYTSTGYARPDAIWIARYDGVASLTGWSGIADTRWPLSQRAKQYQANVKETWGGTSITIDRNIFRGPVASVAHPHTVTSTTPLTARRSQFTTGAAVTTYAPGAPVQVVCQIEGSSAGTSKVWDKLSTGAFVPDYFVDTPSQTTFSSPIPRCSLPYQVTAASGLTTRSGPGTTYKSAGVIATGGLAYVVCQGAGTKVGASKIWDRLLDGRWVSDPSISSPSNTSWSAPIPRCQP